MKESPDSLRARIKYLDTVPDESASLRVEEIIVSPCESDLHLFSVSESERLAASNLIVTGIASFAPVFVAVRVEIPLKCHPISLHRYHLPAAQ